METLAERIGHRLDVMGLTAAQASVQAGFHRDYIRDLQRGKKRNISADAAARLSAVLGCNVPWLLNAEGDEAAIAGAHDGHETGARFGGIVEAGAFRGWDPLNQESDYRYIPLPLDPRYPRASQYAFQVEGDSMDAAGIMAGMWVLAVEAHAWDKVHGEIRDGRKVVVARIRDGRPERELTVKTLRLFRDRMELHPESTNPRHQPVTFYPQPENSIEEVTIIAVVLSATRLF